MAIFKRKKRSESELDRMKAILEVLEGLSLNEELYTQNRHKKKKTSKESLNKRFRDAFLKAHSEVKV